MPEHPPCLHPGPLHDVDDQVGGEAVTGDVRTIRTVICARDVICARELAQSLGIRWRDAVHVTRLRDLRGLVVFNVAVSPTFGAAYEGEGLRSALHRREIWAELRRRAAVSAGLALPEHPSPGFYAAPLAVSGDTEMPLGGGPGASRVDGGRSGSRRPTVDGGLH